MGAGLLLGLALILSCSGCGSSRDELATRASAISGGEAFAGLEAVTRLVVDGERRCGATLVGSRTLLTSAHCVDQGQTLEILLDSGAQLSAASVELHPDYSPTVDSWFGGGSFRDLALIRLQEVPQAPPLTVLAAAPLRGEPIALVGYGATACQALEAGPGEDAGLWCTADSDIKRRGENTVDEVFQHEISIAGVANACTGDSGGAVLAQRDGQELLLGIPAHGQMPCGNVAYATRLDAFVDWLLEAAEGDVQVYRPSPDGGARGDGAVARDGAGAPPPTRDSGDESTISLEGSSGCSLAARPAAPLLGGWWYILALLWCQRRRR